MRRSSATHQRISVVHHYKDNVHIHVAINKIHPKTLTLHDPDDNAVTGALVRAYAFPTCSALPCSGAIQIGAALTDSTGSFQMFLAPSPFTAGAP